MKKVILPVKTGAKACGKYLAGKVYEVSDTEAKRLVDVKGFEYASGALISDDSENTEEKE